MGYTNYFYAPIVMEEEKFKTLAEELQFAYAFAQGTNSSSNNGTNQDKFFSIHNWEGKGEPEFTSERIAFNGDESKGLDHETFSINRDNTKRAAAVGSRDGLVFEFCKTNRKPYDIMVQLSMLRLKHHFPETKISSDGDSSDWKNARALYKKIFKENPPRMNND